jgi:signal transduction histidine kinase/HAMP domain-containing protein
MVPAAPARRRLFRRPRITFAARLLLGGFVLSLAIIAAVSAFLLVSRDQQTRVGAETNAESRAQAYRELVQQVAAPQARFAAQNVAGLPEMATALGSSDPGTAVAALLSGPTQVITDLPDETVAVFDSGGTLVATSEQAGVPQLSSTLPEVEGALRGSPAEAIDLLDPQTPVYDFAAPVTVKGSAQVLGAVVYSMPLTDQLLRLVGAVGQGYTPVIMANRPGAALYALSGNPSDPTLTARSLPASITTAVGRSSDSFAGFSSIPGTGDTAIALEGMNPNSGAPILYVGVETPISLFIGDQTTDELTVVWLALTALLVTWLMVLLFVNRFVRRPVAQLSAGVARIAGGDYGSDIPVTSHDELGVLGRQVNQMRAQIEANIRHVDAAVARLDEVSRALTTTTTGLSSLETAICSAAASLAGPRARALLLTREGDGLVVRARSQGPHPELPEASATAASGGDPELTPAVVNDVLEGRPARLSRGRGDAGSGGQTWSQATLVVPMFYRQRVTGAIAVTGPDPVSDADARALSALASNAAIAVENTRLFEMERETVHRLRELDEMKSDFLATAQHELRTPLTAIVGHLELIRMIWSEADDSQKLSILDNVELATGQLSDMLETMIDLSLVSADNLRMNRRPVTLATAVDDAVGDVTRRFLHGLPVKLTVDIPAGLSVDADAERLRQVIRCLLDNAVKFTDAAGSVTVSARPDAGGDRCTIEVADTGIGIDPALHEKVFERFFQADSGGTRAYGGMGVGLSLVKVLTEAHGATVSIESMPGEGTRVRLDWPCHPPAEAAAAADGQVDLTASRQSQSARDPGSVTS